MSETTHIDVAIVGAGIIGICTAFKLQEAGRNVVLIDRKGIAEETSRGNAGAFAFSDVIPLATSGVLGKLPRWLSDPLGPLTIPPAYLPRITPWTGSPSSIARVSGFRTTMPPPSPRT